MNTVIEDRTAAQQRALALQAELQRFIAIVSEQMKPERIILFGSLASGQVQEWSDLDVAVVAVTDQRFYDRLKDVYRRVRPRVGLDVLVYTPNEWACLTATRRFVQEEIVKKGIVVYERGS